MSNDPRRCTLPSAVNTTIAIDEQSQRHDIFSQIGKIGNIDALKDFGATGVGQGAKFLEKLSDVIGSGGSSFMPGEGSYPGVSIPTFLGAGLEKGADFVGGIVAPAGDILSNLDPTALNTARNELKNTYETIKQGGFKLKDAPQLLESVLNAEKNISSQIQKFLPGGDVPGKKANVPFLKDCNMAIPYAVYLAAQATPKAKYNFVVEFTFHPELIANSADFNYAEIANLAVFPVKTATRPNYTIDYEDVNMYNYRTQIPKGLKYDNATFLFYDDGKDYIMDFYQAVTRAINPISNISSENMQESELKQFDLQGAVGGMPYSTFYNYRSNSVGSVGAVSLPANIFKEITLYHVWTGHGDVDYGTYVTSYKYLDPKIMSFQMAGLDMSDSEPCDITMEFSFSTCRTQNSIPFPGNADTTAGASIETVDRKINVQDISDIGGMPIGGDRVPTAPGQSTNFVPNMPSVPGASFATGTGSTPVLNPQIAREFANADNLSANQIDTINASIAQTNFGGFANSFTGLSPEELAQGYYVNNLTGLIEKKG